MKAYPIEEVQGLGKACVDTGSHRSFWVLPAGNLQLSGASFFRRCLGLALYSWWWEARFVWPASLARPSSVLSWTGQSGRKSATAYSMGWDYSTTCWITDRSSSRQITRIVTLTGKVLRWKLYLQDIDFYLCHVPGKEVHQGVPDALSRLCENMMAARQDKEESQQRAVTLSALQPRQAIPEDKFRRIAKVHHSSMGHWGHALTKRRLNDLSVTDRMITEFIRQCLCCQVMSRLHIQIKTHPFTCTSYNPFEVLHSDHIGPLRTDVNASGDHRCVLKVGRALSHKTTTAAETASCIF